MKISIVGIGRVGSTLAYTITCKGLCNELVLVNRNVDAAAGDAYDLQHSLPFLSRQMKVTHGNVDDTANSDVIAICASVSIDHSVQTRLELGPGNVRLFQDLIPPLAAKSPDAIFLIVSNPVDVLTYYALSFSGFKPEHVIGTGTLLDSARFRSMLSNENRIHPDDLRAYILGEHGENQFPALSIAQAGGVRIVDNVSSRKLFDEAVAAGFKVYHYKGYTNYAISLAAAMIIEAIAFNTRRTMPASVYIDNLYGVHDVCLSLPVVIGREGIIKILQPELNENETLAFQKAASVVRNAITQCSCKDA
jgi:L-lactate dehydrogenase